MWLTALVLLSIIRYGIAEPVPWWGDAIYYRILVDSFKDSDGDGLGDLKGVAKQISYVRAIGADAVILSPLSARSKDCSKPGVVDFTAIDERYGSLESFNELLEKAKKIDLKVLVSLPLKTVSVDSEWFKSSASRVPGYEDRILWRNEDIESPPPDGEKLAWKWHNQRNAYWKVSNNEAILNLCSDGVIAALSSSQCGWLRRGVHGILLTPDFPEQVLCGEKLLKKLSADAMNCVRAAGLEVPIVMVESSLEPDVAARYYEDSGVGANSIISRTLTPPSKPSATKLAISIHTALLTTPEEGSAAWITSGINDSRIATRYGSDMVDMINLITFILPGAVIIQQGDELGVTDTILEWATSTTCWPNQALPSSSPFPWDDTVNAGFTAGEPWLPLAPNYRYANAKSEFNNDFSHVGIVKVGAAMRKSPAMGPHVEIKRLKDALAILRWGGSGSLLVVANPAQQQSEVLPSRIPGLPAEMTVATSSAGSRYPTGSHVSLVKTMKLAPGEAVLLAGGPRHCGGPGPVDKIANKLTEGWQKFNKYFSNK